MKHKFTSDEGLTLKIIMYLFTVWGNWTFMNSFDKTWLKAERKKNSHTLLQSTQFTTQVWKVMCQEKNVSLLVFNIFKLMKKRGYLSLLLFSILGTLQLCQSTSFFKVTCNYTFFHELKKKAPAIKTSQEKMRILFLLLTSRFPVSLDCIKRPWEKTMSMDVSLDCGLWHIHWSHFDLWLSMTDQKECLVGKTIICAASNWKL